MKTYRRLQRYIALMLVLISLSGVAHAWQSGSVWSEVVPFPATSYLWTYVGPGYYYDSDLHIRLGQHKLIFFTRYSMISLFHVRFNGGSWQEVETTVYEGSNNYGPGCRPIAPPWTTEGQYTMDIRWLDNAGWWNYHSYTVYVLPPAQRLFKDNYGNEMILWQGGTTSLDKPGIIVEGFDPTNALSSESYYHIGKNLIQPLRTRGVDVLIFNFSYGGDDLAYNAGFIKSAVTYLNSIKSGNNKIILSGVSMGGVICRYALASMEANSQTHGVSLFFSIDSPQQDAIIDNNLQNFIKSKDQGHPNEALNSVAAKQMLRYDAYDPSGTIHTSFYNQLNQLNGNGYPHLTRNIGVAFAPNVPNPSQGTWLKINSMVDFFEPFGSIISSAYEFTVNTGDPWKEPGSYLAKSTTMQWGGITTALPITKWSIPLVLMNTQWSVPFVSWEWVRQGNATFIPYKSALDIVNGVSKFNATYASTTINYHDVLPNDVIPPILAEVDLSYPPFAPVATPPSNVTATSFTANWQAVGGATSYRLDVSTTSNFSSFVSGYNNLNVGNVTSKSVTGLSTGIQYYYRVRAVNSVGVSPNSNVVSLLKVTMSGPTIVYHADPKGQPANSYTWTANVTGGAPPYTYNWSWPAYGTNSSYTEYFSWNGYGGGSYQKTFRVDVTDSQNATAFATKTITAYNSGGIFDPALRDDGVSMVVVPEEFGLSQNYPNPFNPETEISFALPEVSSVKLTVIDVLGREVLTLRDGQMNPGYHRVKWAGRNASGEQVGTGMYFYRLHAVGESGEEYVKTAKMLLAK